MAVLREKSGTYKWTLAESDELTPLERVERRADTLNRLEVGSLRDPECPVCKNRGYHYYVDADGYFEPALRTRECECMAVRRNLRRLEKSGLLDMLNRYTFCEWKTREPWQKSVLELARKYADEKSGWLLAAGSPGSGKTHICTAICGEFLRAGLDVRYVLWRDMSVRAKGAVNDDDEYDAIIRPLKEVRVLYIDDLFKTVAGGPVTQGDVNLAFEILNYRYNDSGKPTIISTERTMQELMEIDEATGSRIYERSRGYRMDFSLKPNYRMLDGNFK